MTRKTKFIPNISIPSIEFITFNSGTYDFCGQMERNAYADAKRQLPKQWRFNTDLIEYKMNSDGFREQEFDSIDWKNTSAIVGCSYVFGQSIENENTISNILTRDYNTPFANLGSPGASNRLIYNNAINVIKRYRPKKVIIIWSHPNRNTWTYDYDEYNNGKWNHEQLLHQHIDRRERKDMLTDKKVPSDYIDNDYCHNTLYDWKLYQDTMALIDNVIQYRVSDKNIGPMHEAEWIKPKDLKYYTMRQKMEIDELKLDFYNPDHLDFINDFYARDIKVNSGKLVLAHWGRSICGDVADLIYRENFT